MRTFLFITLWAYFLLPTYSQNRNDMAKSDSLFAVGVELYKSNKYEEAIPLFAESDTIDKAVLDSTSNRRNYSAMWLASCYYHLGDEAKAASTYEDYKETPIDRRMTTESDSLSAIGDVHYSNGDYSNALPYYIRCSEIEKEVAGESHSFYKNTLLVIAYCYYFTDNFAEGKAVLEHWRYLFEKQYGKEHLNYALCLDYLAKTHCTFHEYEEAVKFETEATKILCSLLKDNDTSLEYNFNYATMLHNLASFLGREENYAAALENAEKSLALKEKLYGKNREEYLVTLELTMGLNRDLKNPISYELCRQVMELSEAIYGKESLEYVERAQNYYISVVYNHDHNYSKAIDGLEECVRIMKFLNEDGLYEEKMFAIDNLALIYLAGHDYENAAKYYQEELKILEKQSELEPKAKIDIIQNISRCYMNIGKYADADTLLHIALEMEKDNYGEFTKENRNILSLIAQNCEHVSEYVKTIEYEKKSLDIHEKVFGKDVGYADLLCRLANTYSQLGDFSEKNRYVDVALGMIQDIQIDTLAQSDTYQKISYANLARFLGEYYASTRELDKAEHFTMQSIDIYGQEYKIFDESYANSLKNLASIQNKRGNKEDALETSSKAVDILYNSGINEKTTNYANALAGYANILLSCGYVDDAINVYQKANSIFKELLGDESEECMDMSQKLAMIYYGLKNYTYAGGHVIRLMKFLPNIIKTQFTTMTATERMLFLKKYQFAFEDLIPRISYENQHPEVLKAAYNCCLFNKGLLLNTEQEMKKILLESENDKAVALYDSISVTKRLLNESLKLPENERIYPVNVLKEKIRTQERDLLSISKTYGDFTRNMTITWEDVRKELGDRDIAVEFLYFPMQKDTMGYSALILKKDYEYPRYVPCVGILPGSNLNKKERNTYGDTWMTTAIWRRMYDELKDVDNIYFSPVGELHNIAIESLLDLEDPIKRMSERWNFYRLSSTRELATTKERKDIRTAAIYGGLKYDTDTTTMIKNQRRYQNRDFDYVVRNIADSLNLRAGVGELPATEHEAVNIDKELRKRRIADSLYIGINGTETSLKALSGKKMGLLHIATHGFYWTEKEAKSLENLSFLDMDNNNPHLSEDKSLTRSGLLFSGANNALTGKKLPINVDDGILTAKEISSLDLRDMDLVVMSACQTGLGEIKGEGVFGLQRGFKKAGANTLLMSLWKVDDTATQMLMTQFYKNMVAGKSKYESLRDAQHYVREYEREETIKENNDLPLSIHNEKSHENEKKTVKVKPYKDPKYWAAFILLDAIE